MNALMRIQVRVINQATGPLRQVQSQINQITAASVQAQRAQNAMARFDGMIKVGKNLQWTGRQLQQNFTLPLVIAGGAAVKWAFDSEKAMAGVAKVYGDGSRNTRRELDLLGRSFEVLSERFGRNVAEVAAVGQGWAEAGFEGQDLMRLVESTMKAMVLGNMDAEQSTQGLITVMAAFNLNASEMADTLNRLNSVENDVPITLQGLIEGIQRTAGTAKTAGVDINHLVGYLAALVPATGSAAQAGNGIRTILSRLTQPAKQAQAAFKEIGIDINTAGWQALNGSQRMERLSKAFLFNAQTGEKVSDAQRSLISSVIASRWQVNRFDTLMEQVGQDAGFYKKALDTMGDGHKALTRSTSELNTMLGTNQAHFASLVQIIKNNMMKAIQPLLPVLAVFLLQVVGIMRGFAGLNPGMQRFVIFSLLALAAVGPLVKYLGAFSTLIGTLGKSLIYGARFLFGYTEQVVVNTTVQKAQNVQTITHLGLMGRLGKVYQAVTGWIGSVVTSLWAWITGNQAVAASEAELAAASTESSAAAMLASKIGTANAVETAMMMEYTVAQTVAAMEAEAAAAVAAMESMTLMGNMAAVEMAAGFGAASVAAAAESTAAATATAAAMEAEVAAAAAAAAAEAGILSSVLAGFTGALAAVATGVVAVLTSPITLTVAAIAALLGGAALLIQRFYKGGIVQFVNDVGGAIGRLPGIFVRVFQNVIRVLSRMVMVVRRWLSYLNPFQRFSPSLVDNVTNGVGVILAQYARLRAIPGMLESARRALKDFGAAAAPGLAKAKDVQRNDDRKAVAEFSPGAMPQLEAMYREIDALTGVLGVMNAEIDAQNNIVEDWAGKLKVANDQLDVEQAKLDALQKTLQGYNDELNSAKDALSNWTNTPIEGMRAMSDEMFANEQAQKKLRLEMMKLEDSVGPIKDVQDQLAKLNGDIEMARGTQAELRQAGAGSDVLQAYQDQIDQMDAARKALEAGTNGGPATQLAEMQKQLDALQRQGEELDLTNSLQFDPLTRQIEQASNAMREMPFDTIIAGVRAERAEVDRLQKQYDDASAAVEAQQKIVDAAVANRDAISKQYDIERDKLGALKDAYGAVTDQINAMEQAISDFRSAADAAKSASDTTDFQKQFDAGAGADFPDVTGSGFASSPVDMNEMQKVLDKQQADLEKQLKGIGKISFNPFDGLKDKFVEAWDWIKKNAGRLALGAIAGIAFAVLGPIAGLGGLIVGALVGALTALFGPGVFKAIAGAFTTIMPAIWQIIQRLWEPIGNVFSAIFGGIGDALSTVWNSVLEPVFQTFGDVAGAVFGAVAEAGRWMWENVLQPVFQALGDFFNGYVVPVLQMFGAIADIVFRLIYLGAKWLWDNMGPIFSTIVGFIRDYLVFTFNFWAAVVRTVFGMIAALATWLWQNVLSPVWNTIVNFIRGTLGPIFNWLYDNVIGPVLEQIGTDASWLWNNVLSPVWNGVIGFIRGPLADAFNWIRGVVEDVFGAIGRFMARVWDDITTGIRNAINFFIRAFNTIADGVEAVARVVGIKVNINHMSEIGAPKVGGGDAGASNGGGGRMFASGGVLPTGGEIGGVYNRARAIVGEGNPAFPEYVIPTDPRFRGRAKDLWKRAGRHISEAEMGGPGLHTITDTIGTVAGAFRKGAVMAAFAPFLAAANGLINLIPIDVVKGAANKVKNDIYNWAKGQDDRGSTDSGGSGSLPASGGSIDRLISFMKSTGIPHRVTSTYRPGDPGYHGQHRAVDFAAPEPSVDSAELGRIFRAFRPIEKSLKELIYAGPQTDYNIKNGERVHKYAQAEHHNHVHAALKAGGIVMARAGGTTVTAGEGGRDEVVLPLPPGWDSNTMGKRELHFHGDLSFPNIKNGDDAEKFIRNLEALAG